ncbi:methyltransferase domain-containing protein [candidate division KSB1 bacterium]|nr:methyltransferase domain-containing protein [candidate division KSB1 bacterium]RQW00123.1 MAG: methyltransferase domain-containing protein [candidate division KSB1 bacterium]
MVVLFWIVLSCVLIYVISWILNYISYSYLKNKIIIRQKWDLNVCCGETDGGGINVDIVAHAKVPNMVIADVYHLPFKAGVFKSVLSSHTAEHLEKPATFYRELKRVGQEVTILIPPLWDISAVVNLLEHRWIFLGFHTEYKFLPKYIKLPFSASLHKLIGQKIAA